MKPKPRKLILLSAGLLSLVTIGTVALFWQPLIAWYKFQSEFEMLPVNAQGLPEYKHRQTGIIFVKVPGGKFMMGSPEGEVGRFEHEGPVHEVAISAFLISKFEVSQGQWQRVMKNNPSHFIGEQLPVEDVTWEDCNKFCNQTGLALPTEAQWEYACRAGTTTPFSFDTTISRNDANYKAKLTNEIKPVEGSRKRTVSIKQFKPNQFGLFQMHGNVYEWCEDSYQDDFYSSTSKKIRLNPICLLPSSKEKVIRGGCWSSSERQLRSAHRSVVDADLSGYDVGFRPVRNLKQGMRQ